MDLADRILKSVCSEKSLKMLPLSVKIIAARTLRASHERGVDDPLAVVGGFLWLRVLSPALTNPGSAGVLGENPPILHENTRRRVLLATKLIQGASNGVEFGKKEPHMQQFNTFVREAAERIRGFLTAVTEIDDKHLDFREDESVEFFADISSLDSLSFNTLLSMHRLCVSGREKWLVNLSKKGLMGKSGTRLSKLVAQLGPAPPEEPSFMEEEVQQTAQIADVTGSADIDGKAMYWGESHEPVDQLYVIARRLRSDLIANNADMLINEVLDTLRSKGCHEKYYDVVFDMTYFTPTTSLKSILQAGTMLYRALPHEIRKNLRHGIVLHPDRVARSAVQVVQALASEKAQKKLHLCFSWQDLAQWIPLSSVAIPEESKKHILESLAVVKINAAGKRQSRLVKLTPRSLLNIDPKGPRVQNERAIALIDKIQVRGDNQVCLSFVDPDTAKKRDWNEQTVEQFVEKLIQKQGSGAMLSRIASSMRQAKASEKDALERVYEFVNTSQRNDFILDILRLSLNIQKRAEGNPLPHFFVVNKTGGLGQSQIRVWLLTTDSILNLDTSLKVHSEIGLASIVWVKADPHNSDAVLMRVLDKEEPIIVRTEWRDSLVSAIAEALPNAAFRRGSGQDSAVIHSLTEEVSSSHPPPPRSREAIVDTEDVKQTSPRPRVRQVPLGEPPAGRSRTSRGAVPPESPRLRSSFGK